MKASIAISLAKTMQRHRVNNGWQLYGQPTLTFDQKRGEVVCGQVIY